MSVDLGPSLIQVALPLPLDVVTAGLPAEVAALVVPVAGSPGPSGVSAGVEFVQPTPLGTWVIPVPAGLGRRPAVAVYVAGELVDADVTASPTQVTVTWPSPVAGIAVLT